MALTYGYLKARIVSDPVLKGSRHKQETQYHLHATFEYSKSDGLKNQLEAGIAASKDRRERACFGRTSEPDVVSER